MKSNRALAYFLVCMTIMAVSIRAGAQLNCSGGWIGCLSITGNLQNNAGQLDTIQNIQTSSSPTWATINATAGYQLNGAAVASPIICSNTSASSTITGTASKTYFSINCSIAANLLSAGKTIKAEARGIYSGNVADTLVMTEEFCQVSGCGSGVVIQAGTSSSFTLSAVSNQYWDGDFNTNVFTAGAGGTLDTQGKFGYETAGTTLVTDAIQNTTTQTVNTTVTEFLSFSVKFSSNNGANSMTLRNFKVLIQ
jgi:hypothetical protein